MKKLFIYCMIILIISVAGYTQNNALMQSQYKIFVTGFKNIKNNQNFDYYSLALPRSIALTFNKTHKTDFKEEAIPRNILKSMKYNLLVKGQFVVKGNDLIVKFNVINLKRNAVFVKATAVGPAEGQGIFKIIDRLASTLSIITIPSAALNRVIVINIDKKGKITTKLEDYTGSDLRGANFSNRKITNKDFSNTNLTNANFSNSVLTNVNFTGANLTGANFNGAVINNVDFSNANLRGLNFNNARIKNTKFDGANLTNAKFVKLKLNKTSFTRARLNNANFTKAVLVKANFRFAELNGTIFNGANLTDSNLSNANITNAKFRKATLINANLSNSTIKNTDLTGANFKNANLSYITLQSVTLTGAIFQSANMHAANLSGANLDGLNLSGVNLKAANLKKASMKKTNLTNSDMRGTDMTNSDARNANFTRVNFQDADLTNANMENSNLTDANLSRADYRNANLDDTDTSGTQFEPEKPGLHGFLIGPTGGFGFSYYPSSIFPTTDNGACIPNFSYKIGGRMIIPFGRSVGLMIDAGYQHHKVNEKGIYQPTTTEFSKYITFSYIYTSMDILFNLGGFFIHFGGFMDFPKSFSHDSALTLRKYNIGVKGGFGYMFNMFRHFALMFGLDVKIQMMKFGNDDKGKKLFSLTFDVTLLINFR